MKKSINEAMTKQPVSIAGDVALSDALEIMRSWGMRHLPVTESNGAVRGLVSERDILRYMAYNHGVKAQVSDAMTREPFVVEPTESLSKVASRMAAEKFGCAIVADEKGIRGIFTTTDALKILAEILRDPDRNPFKVMCIEDYFRTRAIA